MERRPLIARKKRTGAADQGHVPHRTAAHGPVRQPAEAQRRIPLAVELQVVEAVSMVTMSLVKLQSGSGPAGGRGGRLRARVPVVELARRRRRGPAQRRGRLRAAQQREGSGGRQHLSGQRQPGLRPDRCPQWEVGLKADLAGGRTQLTAAWFDIERDDVLEQFARDSATTIGGIASRGLELAAAANPSEGARIGASLAVTDAVFLPSSNFVQFAGNTPPNVPTVLTNLWGSYRNSGGVPVEIGGAVRIVGDRQANNANTIVLNGYALADAWIAWVHDRVRLTFTVDNLTDTAYASWSDVFYLGHTDPSFFYANTLMLGAPRTYSVMLQTRF